jgi:hypothetical protein
MRARKPIRTISAKSKVVSCKPTETPTFTDKRPSPRARQIDACKQLGIDHKEWESDVKLRTIFKSYTKFQLQ